MMNCLFWERVTYCRYDELFVLGESNLLSLYDLFVLGELLRVVMLNCVCFGRELLRVVILNCVFWERVT